MSIHTDAVTVLTDWQPPTRQQQQLRTAYLRHLRDHSDGMFRDCHPDHITASCLVVSDDRQRVMLNLHRRYETWLQFGGHCDADDRTLAGAALREAVEESGIPDLRLVGDQPVQLDTHEVPCGPVRPAHHLDVRYVAVAPEGSEPVISAESLDVGWFARDTVPTGVDAGLRELIELASRR